MIVQKEELIKTKFGLIPNDWRIKRLKELGSSIIGLTYSPKDVVDKNEGILVLRSSNIQNGRLSFKDNVYVDMEIKDKLYVKKGDLLVCARNGSKQLIGKNAYIDKDYNYSFGAFMSVFRSDYNEYIYQLFQTDMYKKQIQANLGATINQITTKDINSFQFPFPKNIKEQQKIASILSTWDKAIELKERLIEQKKEQKKGLMQKLLTGEVRLPGYEGEWKSVELKHVVEKVIDNRGKTPPLSTEGFELIEVNALEGNKFPDYLKVKKYVDDTTYWTWFRNGHPQKDDILVATVGSVGSTVIMNENRGCIAQNLIALRIKEEYNAEFIYYWMNSNQYFSLINKVLMGAVQPSLKVPHLLQFKIQLPIQREQEKIAEILSNHDETIRLLEREIIYLKQQKQGLMQLLLTGKVRVKV